MNKFKTEQFQVKVLAVGMVALTVILLLPLFVIAHYSVKNVDDFAYFKLPQEVWQSTHSLFALFKSQLIYTVDYWKTWQGTYFSEWLVTVFMGLCGDKYYFVCAYLAIGGIVAGELALFKVIFVNMLKVDKYRYLILSLSCILMQILLMPVPCEAFYWFCGVGIYTWIYALEVLLAALVLHTINRPRRGWKGAAKEAGILFLCFAVAGGNYVTCILVFVLWAGCVSLLWLYRHRDRVLMTVNFVFYIVCMLLAICAPGNQTRLLLSQDQANGYPAFESIFRALMEAAVYLCQWTVLPYVTAGVMLIPIMSAMVKARKLRYPLPFLVTFVTFGMFAAQFAPTLYTLGIIGAGRIKNLYRMTMLLWLYGNEFYWIGWLNRKKGEDKTAETGASWLLPGWCAGLAVMICALYLWGGTTVTSVSAFFALHRGQAQQYKAEYDERLEILENENISVVEFQPYSVMPYVLFFGDIVEDADNWVNQAVAEAYGKESVRLLKKQ